VTTILVLVLYLRPYLYKAVLVNNEYWNVYLSNMHTEVFSRHGQYCISKDFFSRFWKSKKLLSRGNNHRPMVKLKRLDKN